jgi:hypothetical protein
VATVLGLGFVETGTLALWWNVLGDYRPLYPVASLQGHQRRCGHAIFTAKPRHHARGGSFPVLVRLSKLRLGNSSPPSQGPNIANTLFTLSTTCSATVI